jgi:hypothetical protein
VARPGGSEEHGSVDTGVIARAVQVEDINLTVPDGFGRCDAFYLAHTITLVLCVYIVLHIAVAQGSCQSHT